MEQTNYYQHLHFEERKESKEYAVNKLMGVLGLIARVKDRNEIIVQCCKDLLGTDTNGRVKATTEDKQRYEANKATIKRLRQYYNYCLSKLSKFN